MKYYSIAGVLFVMLVFLPNAALAEDYELREAYRHEEVRQHWADVRKPVPPGEYKIKIDDRVFTMTVPQGRTAASYNRKDIDTQHFREQIFSDREEKALGLIGFRQKHQSGIWPLVRSYGETSIGAGLFLPQDQTKSELYWADYRTVESLIARTRDNGVSVTVFDERGNRIGKKEIPRDVVVINGRQWARERYEKGDSARAVAGLPEETVDTYYTGLSANSYIKLGVRYPYLASRYPKDKERPEWVKQSSAFIAEALSSIKISASASSTEPDFLTVDESQNTPIEMLAP